MTTNAQLRKWLDEWASEGWKLTTKWRDIEYRLPHKTIEKLATFIATRSAEAERKIVFCENHPKKQAGWCVDCWMASRYKIKQARADERRKAAKKSADKARCILCKKEKPAICGHCKQKEFSNILLRDTEWARADERKKCMRDFQGMTASQYVQQVRKDERQRTLNEVKEKLEYLAGGGYDYKWKFEKWDKFWEELEAR